MAIRDRIQSLGGLPIQIDYTARDYDSIRSELLKLTDVLVPAWTDKQPSDIGVAILEAVSYVSDILSYTLDRNINESYLASAQTRESVINILRLIGYELSPASPATVNMVIRTSVNNVTLPAGFKVRTGSTTLVSALEYELTQAVTLPTAGLYCVSSEANQCTRVFAQNPEINDNLVFVAGEARLDVLGASNGKEDQRFILPNSPVCLNADGTSSIVVYIDNVAWEGRTTFLGADPDSQVFVYRILADQSATVQFGDGVTGAIPNINSTIAVSYRVNGGEVTNRAGVGSINLFDSVNGVSTVYNLNQPSGGSDPEDIETAKKQGPLSLRALNRCVTLEDFETMALRVPGGGIRSARAVQGDSPIEVNLYIAAEGENPVPSGRWYRRIKNGYGTLGAVGRWLETKKPIPTILNVLAPVVVKPYLQAEIFLYNNVLRQQVVSEVDTTLQNLFTDVGNNFGEGVTLSSVIQAIENTQGVDYLNAQAFHRIPTARYYAGNEASFGDSVVSITGMNVQTRRGSYSIVFRTYNSFNLYYEGNVLLDENNQTLLFGTNLVNTVSFYNADNLSTQAEELLQFKIEITTGTALPAYGDTWQFGVDQYLGNIETQEYEIVVSPIQTSGLLNPSEINLTFVGGIG